jgi:hypothetical protein
MAGKGPHFAADYGMEAGRTMLMNIRQAGAAAGTDSARAAAAASDTIAPIAESTQSLSRGNATVVTQSSNDTTSFGQVRSRLISSRTSIPVSQRTKLDFADTIEGILSSLERRKDNVSSTVQQQCRGEGPNPNQGLLKDSEIKKLSMLCTQQMMASKEGNALATTTAGGTAEVDLGYADVDGNLVSQLVEVLEHHVVSASRISLIDAAFEASHKIQRRKQNQPRAGSTDSPNYDTMDEVRRWFSTSCRIPRSNAKRSLPSHRYFDHLCSLFSVGKNLWPQFTKKNEHRARSCGHPIIHHDQSVYRPSSRQ